ncbi:antA/AntB antirepressor family protein [Anaerovirgula multivorans]|nr:antA/AntB antirepressor family protein [Anaerovirgula multivorans]
MKVTANENLEQVVSAKDLYLGLGLNRTHWKRWSEQNIVQNEFFPENVHWVGFAIMANGNETVDFAVSLEFAKHIAMMARTAKSHEYRSYFLELEKKWNSPEVVMARALKMAESRISQLQGTIEEQKPFGIS